MSSNTQFPILKWAQRKDKLFITIMVVHTKKPSVDIVEGKTLNYSGTDGTKNYSFEIELFDEVLKDESKYTLDARNIFLNLKKKTSGPYWPRLTKDTKKLHWVEIDWAYFVDEDEEEDATQPNFDGQDFGDMGGEMDDDEDDVAQPEGDKKDEDKKEEDKKEEKKEDDKKEEKKEDDKKDEKKEDDKKEEKKDEGKKADLSDLDKEETK